MRGGVIGVGLLIAIGIATGFLLRHSPDAEDPLVDSDVMSIPQSSVLEASVAAQELVPPAARVAVEESSVRILVVDERGVPVRAAIVQFMEESDRFVEIGERAVRTDEHGDCVLERSAVLACPESAFLHVHASGFAPWQCVLAELQSELRATKGVVERTVVLRRGATVHGVIVDRSGQACEGLEVWFSGAYIMAIPRIPTARVAPTADADRVHWAVTDSQGRFTIAGLSPGPCFAVAAGRYFYCSEGGATGWSGAPYNLEEGAEEHLRWVADEVCIGILDFAGDVLDSCSVRYPHNARSSGAASQVVLRHWPECSGERLGKKSMHVLATPPHGERAVFRVRGWLRNSGHFRSELVALPAISNPRAQFVSGTSEPFATGSLRVDVVDSRGKSVPVRVVFVSGDAVSNRTFLDPEEESSVFGGRARLGESMVVPVGTYTVKVDDTLTTFHRPLERTCRVVPSGETLVRFELECPVVRVEFHSPIRLGRQQVLVGLESKQPKNGEGSRWVGVGLDPERGAVRCLPEGVYLMQFQGVADESSRTQRVEVTGESVQVRWPRLRK